MIKLIRTEEPLYICMHDFVACGMLITTPVVLIRLNPHLLTDNGIFTCIQKFFLRVQTINKQLTF